MSVLSLILQGIWVLVIAGAITVVIMENKNPVKSLSWILVLVFLPVVGLMLYIMFGQNYRKRKMISRSEIKKITSRPVASFDLKKLDPLLIDNNQYNLIKLLYNNSSSELFANNDIKILATGETTFLSFLEAIEKAKDHIHIEFFIFENDRVSNLLRELLIKKRKEGVRVRLIYDYWGSFRIPKSYIRSLKDAGVFVTPFLPVKIGLGKSKINYRDHRKLLIVDGKIGFIGGLNFADRYLYGNKLGQWRDTFARIEGSAVHGLQMQFLVDWYFVEGKMITDMKYYPKPIISERKNMIQIVSSGPDTDWPYIMQGIASAIMSATKYIYIHTPYFVPNQTINDSLIMAALSGVDVRLMVPLKSDSISTSYSSASYLEDVLNAGVKVLNYVDGFLHSKAIVIDDFISIVGSSNLDERSFYQNFEANAFIYDNITATELKNHFLEDCEKCVEILSEEWQKRSKWQKFKESFARLFSPLQ